MKIIHISDLHHGAHSGCEKLIDLIISEYKNEATKPIVILTGDLVDSSLQKSEMREIKLILKKLVDDGFKLLMCPGNHDLKRAGGTGNPRKSIYIFNKYFKDLIPKGLNYKGEEDNDLLNYPLIHKIDNHFFIGLNSLEGKPLLTLGELGKNQRAELKHDIETIRKKESDPVIIVYLHNNPFRFDYRYDFLKLLDRKKFRTIVKGVNVLLSGHWHGNKRYHHMEEMYEIDCIQVTGRSTSSSSSLYWTEIDTNNYQTFPIKHDK